MARGEAEAVDKVVHDLLHKAEARAAEIVRAHDKEMRALVAALEKEESLEPHQIGAVPGPNRTVERPPKAAKPAPKQAAAAAASKRIKRYT